MTDSARFDRSALMHTYAEPTVTFVRGEGSLLYDADDRPYLDFLSGLAVTSLGHAHPVVAEAIATQARTLSHVSNLFGNAVGPGVAATLDRLVGGGVERAGGQVFFANSGAEANECALKLARRWAGPDRFAVVATTDAFHGRTLAALAATGQFEKQAAFAPMPEGFAHVAYGDIDAMDAALDPARVAAVLVEPIQGEAGVVVPSSDYLGAVRRLCTERNVMLMVKAIRTSLRGRGRRGEPPRPGGCPFFRHARESLQTGGRQSGRPEGRRDGVLRRVLSDGEGEGSGPGPAECLPEPGSRPSGWHREGPPEVERERREEAGRPQGRWIEAG